MSSDNLVRLFAFILEKLVISKKGKTSKEVVKSPKSVITALIET